MALTGFKPLHSDPDAAALQLFRARPLCRQIKGMTRMTLTVDKEWNSVMFVKPIIAETVVRLAVLKKFKNAQFPELKFVFTIFSDYARPCGSQRILAQQYITISWFPV